MSKYTESFESYAGSIRGSTTFKDVFNHQQSKINELLKENERLKYNHMINEDAFFTNKQQAEKINELLERLKECEKNLFYITQSNSYTGRLVPVNEESVVFLKETYRELAIEYFKKYEGLNDNK